MWLFVQIFNNKIANILDILFMFDSYSYMNEYDFNLYHCPMITLILHSKNEFSRTIPEKLFSPENLESTWSALRVLSNEYLPEIPGE